MLKNHKIFIQNYVFLLLFCFFISILRIYKIDKNKVPKENKINEDHLINSHNNSTKFKWMYIYNIGYIYNIEKGYLWNNTFKKIF